MPSSLSRRTVARGAAWSVPTIAVLGAAPALAASSGACSSSAYPDGTFRVADNVTSGEYTEFPVSLRNACTSVAIPAGTIVTLQLTNDNTDNGQYKTVTSTQYATTGPTSYTTATPDQTATWTFTTTADIPGSGTLLLPVYVTNGLWTANWRITSYPAGYTDPNPTNNSVTAFADS